MSGAPQPNDTEWRTLYRLGALAAIATVGVTVAQIVLGVMWPPPDFAPTASATARILTMAQSAPVLTFLKLDGLMVLDYVLLIVVYLASQPRVGRPSLQLRQAI